MVRRNYFFLLILMSVLSLLAFTSCSDDEDVTINASVSGTAKASPSDVKNGDEISLTIGGTSHSSASEINGKEYYPVIHYLIDGTEVAVSNEKELPFTAKWVVKDLSVGEHTLSVDITSSRKGATYENKVLPSTITVIE